jgi:hypothetical protein
MNGDEIQRRLAGESVALHRELASGVSEQFLEYLKEQGGNGSQLVNNPNEITSEDLIRYVEGSLTADRDRYNRVEEAISKDTDLFDEYVELCEQIWTGRVLNPATSKPWKGLGIGYPRKISGADPVGDVEGPVSVTTEDLIRYVEGSLAKDATRYRRIEEAICNDVELFEEVQELRRSIWGSGDGSAEG